MLIVRTHLKISISGFMHPEFGEPSGLNLWLKAQSICYDSWLDGTVNMAN